MRPPGPGPISSTRSLPADVGRARDLSRDVQIEQKMLPEALVGAEVVRGDDVAKRRQVLGHARSRREAISAASLIAAMRLSGRATPLPAMSSAVPWSGDVRTIGRPSVTLTAS